MLVKELYMRDAIFLVLVPTDKMVADIFTKPLENKEFQRLRDMLLNASRS